MTAVSAVGPASADQPAPRRMDTVWRWRWIAVGVGSALSIGLPLLLGHRGTHVALNLFLPGAGLFGVNTLGAVAFVVLTVAGVAAWLRWGLDWPLLALLAGAMVASAVAVHAAPAHLGAFTGSPTVQRGAHEFPLVLLVVGALSRLGRVVRRLPGVAALQRRRAARAGGLAALSRLNVVDRCRTVSIASLAGLGAGENATFAAAVAAPDVARRAHRIGVVARGRVRGDPLRTDHAPTRTALALTGQLEQSRMERLVDDAEAAIAGVPCSEPGWVRPLDASLAAATLHRAGRPDAAPSLRILYREHLRLRRGHRAAAWWTPLAIPVGSSATWEHAAATGIARALGVVDDADWTALRTRALGAAARGTRDPHDERLIAAARLWLAFVDDQPGNAIMGRPTVRHDPLAVALDRLADRLRADPEALRRTPTAPAA
jgi:hypothetical protein